MKFTKLVFVVTMPLVIAYMAMVEVNRSQLNRELLDAAKSGDLKTVQANLSAGADPDAMDRFGLTAIIWAAYTNNPDVVDLLAQNGANVNARNKNGDNALLWAAVFGYEKVINVLLAHNAGIEEREPINGATPLMTAASKGHTATVKLLLEHSADVNTQDKKGKSALDYASLSGNMETALTLIENGAEFQGSNPSGIINTLVYLSENDEPTAVEIFTMKAQRGDDGKPKTEALLVDVDEEPLFTFAIQWGEGFLEQKGSYNF